MHPLLDREACWWKVKVQSLSLTMAEDIDPLEVCFTNARQQSWPLSATLMGLASCCSTAPAACYPLPP